MGIVKHWHRLPREVMDFPLPSPPSPDHEDLLNLSRFLRRVLFFMMEKNFNVAFANGKALLNYWWKLQPLNERLVFGSFKSFQVTALLATSELPLCCQRCA